MAKLQKGMLVIKGKIDGLSFYKINGKNVVRKAYGPSSDTIKNNPNYTSVKNNNKEFAGATQVSKAIRTGLGSVGKKFQDAYMASRLTGVCRRCISDGVGNIGEREVNLKKNNTHLIGFSLIKNTGLDKIVKATYKLILDKNHNQFNVIIPKLINTDFVNPASFATHFKYTLIAVVLSPYNYNKKQDQYLPLDQKKNGLSFKASSALLPINQTHEEIALTITTTKDLFGTNHNAITIWLGIALYNNETKEELMLENSRVMQCIAVY